MNKCIYWEQKFDERIEVALEIDIGMEYIIIDEYKSYLDGRNIVD